MSALTITTSNQPLNFAETEKKILAYWDQHQIFQQTISSRPESNPYVFYDGPPFATGLPHYGHILASTTKDVIPRYWTMKGYRVERKWGWDCHGLPVENIVEKELQLKDKPAIEKYGIANFNDACRATVLRYANEWKTVIHRLGRFVDMEHDYKTMEPWYMESLWWVFKQLWEKQLIYKGYKSMHICPRCETPLSNFEVTQGYKEVKDISVYVEFKVTNAKEKLNLDQSVYLIAWTTTPWTLPGNVLLAINPHIDYVLFEGQQPGNIYIAAKERLAAFNEPETYTIIQTIPGEALVGLTYTPVFPYYQDTPNAFRVVTAEFVALDEGTGIVHIAPAFGEDDLEVGKREQVPLVQHVGMNGKFKPEVTDFAGLSVKPKDNPLETDIKILKYLVDHDALYLKQNITHSYPHCWRCDTSLINYATDSWFVAVTKIKPQLLENNEQITWLPDHIKHGRFGDWLQNARDWAISRNRYWGTPLPIWQATDGDRICVGSIAELEKLTGQSITDLHKQYVDQLVITKDGKDYHRIPEVLDCWFESGAMPYASFHYPFENKEKFENSFPAEFISEGQDQTRGWFYTLHVLATALTIGSNPSIPCVKSSSAFKNCIVSGIVLAEDGKKMSKRLNNYPDPMTVAEKYGADSLRLYLMSSPVVRAENLNFSEKGVEDIRKRILNIAWNVYSFYALYKTDTDSIEFPENPAHSLDRWLKSLTDILTNQVIEAMNAYDVVTASRLLMEYVDKLSTWYVRLSRERIKDQTANQEALATLKAALYRWALLIAPFAPFISELLYQNVHTHPLASIHLEQYPKSVSQVDKIIIEIMSQVQEIVTLGHGIRKAKNISLKQPLASVTVDGRQPVSREIADLICHELNVKQVIWSNTSNTVMVTLDTVLTQELIEEGEVRCLIRDIQAARKRSGVGINEAVVVTLPSWPKAYEAEIKKKVKASQLVQGDTLTIVH